MGEMRYFLGSWNPAFSSFRISDRERFVLIFTAEMGGIGGRSWSAENLLTHFRRDPLTQRSMSSWQKKNFSTLGVVNLY